MNPTSPVDFGHARRVRCGGQRTAHPPGGHAMAISQEEHLKELSKGYRFDWKDQDHSVFTPKRGLSPAVVEEISELKSEPDWMRKFRLKALRYFQMRPMPWWGADLSAIDFDN